MAVTCLVRLHADTLSFTSWKAVHICTFGLLLQVSRQQIFSAVDVKVNNIKITFENATQYDNFYENLYSGCGGCLLQHVSLSSHWMIKANKYLHILYTKHLHQQFLYPALTVLFKIYLYIFIINLCPKRWKSCHKYDKLHSKLVRFWRSYLMNLWYNRSIAFFFCCCFCALFTQTLSS